METEKNIIKKNRKPFANLPITSPWRYRVPIYRPISKKKLNIPTNKMIVTRKPTNVDMSNFEKTQLIQQFPSMHQHPTYVHKMLLDSRTTANNSFYPMRPNIPTFSKNYLPIQQPQQQLQPKFINCMPTPTPQFSNYRFNMPIMNSKPSMAKNLTYILPKYGEPKYLIQSDTIPKGIIAAKM